MLESYTLPSRRSCSGIFTQHHSTKIPENTQGVWAHKNEQLNHSYSLKPLVTAVQVYVIQGTNTANRMHESAIWWVPSRLPWRFYDTGTWKLLVPVLDPDQSRSTLFFFYKNIFYKNIEADICEILRIF